MRHATRSAHGLRAQPTSCAGGRGGLGGLGGAGGGGTLGGARGGPGGSGGGDGAGSTSAPDPTACTSAPAIPACLAFISSAPEDTAFAIVAAVRCELSGSATGAFTDVRNRARGAATMIAVDGTPSAASAMPKGPWAFLMELVIAEATPLMETEGGKLSMTREALPLLELAARLRLLLLRPAGETDVVLGCEGGQLVGASAASRDAGELPLPPPSPSRACCGAPDGKQTRNHFFHSAPVQL